MPRLKHTDNKVGEGKGYDEGKAKAMPYKRVISDIELAIFVVETLAFGQKIQHIYKSHGGTKWGWVMSGYPFPIRPYSRGVLPQMGCARLHAQNWRCRQKARKLQSEEIEQVV